MRDSCRAACRSAVARSAGPGGGLRTWSVMCTSSPCSPTGVKVSVTFCVWAFDHLADPPASITQNRTFLRAALPTGHHGELHLHRPHLELQPRVPRLLCLL